MSSPSTPTSNGNNNNQDPTVNLNQPITDPSGNNNQAPIVILNQTITDPSGNFVVTNMQSLDTNGDVVTETTFTTTNPTIQNASD